MITELAKGHPLDVQEAVQLGLARMAWMFDQRNEDLSLKQLEALNDVLQVGQCPLAELQACEQDMADGVRKVLTRKSALANDTAADDPHAAGWNFAFTTLLLGPGDRLEPLVLPIIEKLLASDDWGWLPRVHRGDRIDRLVQLIGDPTLLDKINELAGTEPIHPNAQRWLDLGGMSDYRSLQWKLVRESVSTLFSPPLQRGANNCWLVARNRDNYRNDVPGLLDLFRGFLHNGTLAFRNAAGGIDQVEPEPYPEQAMQWARQTRDQWSQTGNTGTFAAQDKVKLIAALKRACPNAGLSDEQWGQAIKPHFDRLQAASRGKVRVLDVIEQVIAAHIGLSPAVLAQPHRLMLEKGADLDVAKYRLEKHQRLVRDVLFAVETANFSPLAMVWQSTYSAHVVREKLEECWKPIEKALRAELKAQPGMQEYLSNVREVFMQNATLRMDSSDDFNGLMFRLFLKVPGADGRGLPVRNSRELIDWLAHYVKLAGQKGSTAAPANTKACADCVKQALRKPHFQATVGKTIARTDAGAWSQPLWLVPVSFDVRQRGDFNAAPRPNGSAYDDACVDPPLATHYTSYIHDSNQNYRLGRWDLEARLIGPQTMSDEEGLRRYINGARSLQDGELPLLDFESHVRVNGGLVVSFNMPSRDMRHVLTVKPDHPSFRPAWKNRGLSAKQWIAQTLKTPMKQQLKRPMAPDEARAWVGRVLRRCGLRNTELAQVDAAIDVVLQLARRRDKLSATDDVPLKTLIWALSCGRVKSLLIPRGSQLKTELEKAVLNELPDAPCVVVADTNWKSGPNAAYRVNPFTGKVQHVLGHDIPEANGRHRFEVTDIQRSFVF